MGFNRTAAKAYLVLACFIAAAILAYVLNNDYVLWSALPSTNSILIVLAYYFGQPLYDLFIFLFAYNVYKSDKSLGSAIRGTVASILALVGLDIMALPHVTSSILSFSGTLTLVPNPLLTPFGGYQLIRFIAGPSGVVTFWNDFGSQVIIPILLLGAALAIAEPHWFIEIVGGISSKHQDRFKAYILLVALVLAAAWSYLLNNQYEAWSASATNPILSFVLYYVTQTVYDLFLFLFAYTIYKQSDTVDAAIRGSIASILALIGGDIIALPYSMYSILTLGGNFTLVSNPQLSPFGDFQVTRALAGSSGLVTFWIDFSAHVIIPIILLTVALVLAKPKWFLAIVERDADGF